MSMTVAYIIFGIVMLHLLLGFVWVFYKFYKKGKQPEKETVPEEKGEGNTSY